MIPKGSLVPRSPDEPHRVSTPLELLFDLVFVIAIAAAGAGLHHAISEGHAADGIQRYLRTFFAIWWAWMNFTWYASAYDSDDRAYRLAVFVQLSGALIVAAGVPSAFKSNDLAIITSGYVVMRLAMVTQWVRAGVADPARRVTAFRYAIGVALVQVGWLSLLLVPPAWRLVGFAVFGLGELAVPVWAERAGGTTWHPHHIAERYGLFTIIVLGETILAASIAIQVVIDAGSLSGPLVAIIVGGLLIVLALWWLYFDDPGHHPSTSLVHGFAWGYGHYFVFAAAAAVGAGIAVAVDHASGQAAVSSARAGMAVAVPVAIYLVSLWSLRRLSSRARGRPSPIGLAVAAAVLITPFFPQPVLSIGLLLVGFLIWKATGRETVAPTDR